MLARSPTSGRVEGSFGELRLSPILRSSFSGACMSGPASLVVILSSYLIALGRTARCCALHRELDPGSMRRGRNRHHSDTTGNERSYGRIAQGRGRNEVIDVGRPPMWCMPDQPISGRGEEKGRRSSRPSLGSTIRSRRAAVVPRVTKCPVAHTSPFRRSTVRSSGTGREPRKGDSRKERAYLRPHRKSPNPGGWVIRTLPRNGGRHEQHRRDR